VPKKYNGLEFSLPQALQMEEAFAWVDGSLGWTITLCAGANWFIGFLDPELAQDLFSNKEVCFAGSGRPSGIAKMNESGYEISGIWKYATGAPHATVFTANCVIERNGKIIPNEDGSPLIRSFLFLKDEVNIHKDWTSIGMIATASHSFEVNQLQVSKQRCFTIDSREAILPQPIWQYPFLQFAEATLAVNSSGMASRFLEICTELFAGRKKDRSLPEKAAPLVHEKLEIAKNRLQEERKVFFAILQRSWDHFTNHNSLPSEILEKISRSSRALAKAALQVTDDLYPYCGMIAARPNTEINRIWRNLHTASQHNLLLY
jgi:alkylation response protein AidB-like acyl-CoA dehydrogenase